MEYNGINQLELAGNAWLRSHCVAGISKTCAWTWHQCEGEKGYNQNCYFRKLKTKNYPINYMFSLNLWLFWNNATLETVTVLKYNMELELKRKRWRKEMQERNEVQAKALSAKFS